MIRDEIYLVTEQAALDLGLSDSSYKNKVSFTVDPIRNWIIGFNIIDSDAESGLGIEFEVLRVPKEVSDQIVTEMHHFIGSKLEALILESLEAAMEEDPPEELSEHQ